MTLRQIVPGRAWHRFVRFTRVAMPLSLLALAIVPAAGARAEDDSGSGTIGWPSIPFTCPGNGGTTSDFAPWQPVDVEPADGPQLVTIANVEVSRCSTAEVSVKVSDASVAALDLVVQYNPEVAIATSCKGDGVVCNTGVAGVVQLSALSMNGLAGHSIVITFAVYGDQGDATALVPSHVLCSNALAENVPCSAGYGRLAASIDHVSMPMFPYSRTQPVPSGRYTR